MPVTVDVDNGVITVTQDSWVVDIVREGPPSVAIPSSDADNAIIYGTDGKVFVPKDHGMLTGLDHDDHPQYLNEIRAVAWGDVRYARVTISDEPPDSPEVGQIWVPSG